MIGKRIICLIAIVWAECSKTEYSAQNEKNTFSLISLPYSYYSLEPVLWAQVVYFHHKKEQNKFTEKLNTLVSSNSNYEDLTVVELLQNYGLKDKNLARNAGGYYNHALFWWSLVPTSCNKGEPEGKLLRDIEKYFGSFEGFQAEFERRAVALFGSGWIWLCLNEGDDLIINGKSEEYSPLSSNECLPIVGIDLWEHAYSLNYQDEVKRWVQFWWQIVDWELVEYWYEEYILERTPVPV